jgi:carboxypeptidase C (cathepsin A)
MIDLLGHKSVIITVFKKLTDLDISEIEKVVNFVFKDFFKKYGLNSISIRTHFDNSNINNGYIQLDSACEALGGTYSRIFFNNSIEYHPTNNFNNVEIIKYTVLIDGLNKIKEKWEIKAKRKQTLFDKQYNVVDPLSKAKEKLENKYQTKYGKSISKILNDKQCRKDLSADDKLIIQLLNGEPLSELYIYNLFQYNVLDKIIKRFFVSGYCDPTMHTIKDCANDIIKSYSKKEIGININAKCFYEKMQNSGIGLILIFDNKVTNDPIFKDTIEKSLLQSYFNKEKL